MWSESGSTEVHIFNIIIRMGIVDIVVNVIFVYEIICICISLWINYHVIINVWAVLIWFILMLLY